MAAKNQGKAKGEGGNAGTVVSHSTLTDAHAIVKAALDSALLGPLYLRSIDDPPRGSITEGRDITASFNELIHEGKACQYELLQRAHSAAFVNERINQRIAGPLWQAFRDERDGLKRSFKGDGGATAYGATLDRALRIWRVSTTRPPTEEEIAEDRKFESRLVLPVLPNAGHRNVFRNITGPDDPSIPPEGTVYRTTAEVPTVERYRRWVEEFAAEVEMCVDRFGGDADLPHELARLIGEVKAFEVCSGEGHVLVQHLNTTGIGQDVLRKVADGKARLLLRLEEIVKEHAPQTPDPSGQGRLRWKGNTMELAVLLHELEMKGWIDGGRTRSKLATLVSTLFNRSDGEPLELSTLKTYMGKEYPRTPREGVEFTMTVNPDKT